MLCFHLFNFEYETLHTNNIKWHSCEEKVVRNNKNNALRGEVNDH